MLATRTPGMLEPLINLDHVHQKAPHVAQVAILLLFTITEAAMILSCSTCSASGVTFAYVIPFALALFILCFTLRMVREYDSRGALHLHHTTDEHDRYNSTIHRHAHSVF